MGVELAVVTGAASGVGAATVARLRKRGIDVIGIDLAEALAADDEGLAHVRGSVADGEVWTDVQSLARGHFGKDPSIVVFSAAVFNVGTILELTEDEWLQHFTVNVHSVFRGLRLLLPSMVERKKGSVVTVASVDAYMVEQGAAGYCTSKGALLQLTRSVAVDYARDGIRANCVAPGVIDTPFFRRHLSTAADPENFLEVRRQRNPLGRFLEADEVAATVEFAALDASGMTGSVLTVDAGLSASFDFRTGDEGA